MLLQVLDSYELQNEWYCQVIKMTRNRPYPNSAATYQSWALLTLSISVFLPSGYFLRSAGASWLPGFDADARSFLYHHLKGVAVADDAVGPLAAYALKCLARVLENGPRKYAPAYSEIKSYLLRNPSARLAPMSLPFFLVNGNYTVSGFDASSTVYEVCQQLCDAIGIRPVEESGYGLFVNDSLVPA